MCPDSTYATVVFFPPGSVRTVGKIGRVHFLWTLESGLTVDSNTIHTDTQTFTACFPHFLTHTRSEADRQWH